MNKLRLAVIAFLLCILAANAVAASRAAVDSHHCATEPDGVITDLFRHKQNQQRRARLAAQGLVADTGAPAYLPDNGNIAIVDSSEGAVVQPNTFDLQQRSLRFSPSGTGATQYTAAAGSLGFDVDGSQNGSALSGLADDDSRLIRLPFAFPFFGQRYESVYVNSDGNLSFNEGDNASTTRSLGRGISGPPRIMPFFQDLDPSQPDAAVRYFGAADRAVVTWDNVPEWADRGIGPRQTFQAILYADGRIEFHYRSITIDDAVVGIAPGNLLNGSTAADFSAGASTPTSGALAEIFSSTTTMDVVSISKKFYRNHEDAYDYVVVFNNMGLNEAAGAFASERNIRNQVLGAGNFLRQNPIFDTGADWGSALRLQSFLNMGPLSNYPADPKAVIPIFSSSRNTALSVMGQESGHRFLAYARYLDPQTNRPSSALLGRDNAHWSFFFNSDASVVEGNRITDRGEGQSPRFQTVGTVEHYSALDQYIMGLRGPDEVPPTFLVKNPTAGFSPASAPRSGVTFDGTRQDITVQMIVDAEGKRIPDATVAQKHFNFAFVLLTAAGTQPLAEDAAQVDRLRLAWEDFFANAVDNRGTARTGLIKQLRLSTWPAGGLLKGAAAPATVSIAAPAASNLDVRLSADAGLLAVPAVVTIPAGRTSVSFNLTGLRQGVSELTATASDPAFEFTRTFVQVREDATQLRLEVVSGDKQQGGRGNALPQAIILRVRDENKVPFSGVSIIFAPTADGAVTPARGTTGPDGLLQINWRLSSTASANSLSVALDAAPSVTASVTATAADRPVFSADAVVNGASFNTGASSTNKALAPGSLVTIFGASFAPTNAIASGFPLPTTLSSVGVTVNGVAAPLIFVSPTQINFQVPYGLSGTSAQVIVSNVGGASAPATLPLAAVQPGIFFDPPSGLGAIVQNSDGALTSQRPARSGDFLQIYATGLGNVSPAVPAGFPASVSPLSRTVAQPQVTIAGRATQVVFSGLAPGFSGLYELTIQVPPGVPAGRQPVSLIVGGLASNEVFIMTADAASATPE